MTRTSRLAMRSLALAHFAWGLGLLLLGAWLAISAFLMLPHMSTGTVWTNLPATLMLAVTQTAPLGALGGWMLVLGHWTWTGHPKLRTALLLTHALVLLPSALVMAVGVYALGDAARNAEGGSGLLSPIVLWPLALGASACTLAMCSIGFALGVLQKHGKPGDPG